MSEQRILLFSGGALGPWALDEIKADDVLVGADRGALFLVEHGFRPDMAIGDFDSVSLEELQRIQQASKHVVACDPVMKDVTDTDMAFDWSIRQEPSELLMLGVVGTRLDHTLSNIQLLKKAADSGVSCRIADAANQIQLVRGPADRQLIRRSRFTHVSLIPLSMEVTGITLDGFRYPLRQAALALGQSLGLSNVLIQDVGMISVAEGLLLIVESMD